MADNRSEEQIRFDDLVSDLIQNIDASDFNGTLLQGLEHQTPDFWKYLMDYMYHEYEDQYLNHAPIQQEDFSGQPSFVEFLNDYIDLDNNKNRDVKWSTIWKVIKSNAFNDETGMWNESVNNLVKQFVNAFDANGRIYIKGKEGEPNSVYISIYDIIHANAGNKFTGSLDTNDWVLPNINVDKNTYGQVRGKDKILSVLNNENELQFTNPINPTDVYSDEEMKEILFTAQGSALKIYNLYELNHPWEETLDNYFTDELGMILNYWKVTLEQYREGFSNKTIFPSFDLIQFLLFYSKSFPQRPEGHELFNDYADIPNFVTPDRSSWLRLLMPKYLRKVEVEDLNRNFWVLGQTMSALCSFLFGPEAPFAKLFENMASEITQLWENVLYLWLAYAMLTQKQEITDVHTEIIYLPNSVYEPYIKFDNFDKETIVFDDSFWEDVKAKCKYIVTQHSDSHVVIVPKIKWKNFKHNYYEVEVWPGILWYNRTTNEYTYSKFRTLKKISDTIYNEDLRQYCLSASQASLTIATKVLGGFDFDETFIQYTVPDLNHLLTAWGMSTNDYKNLLEEWGMGVGQSLLNFYASYSADLPADSGRTGFLIEKDLNDEYIYPATITTTEQWVNDHDGIIVDAASSTYYSLCWAIKKDEFNYSLIPSDYVLDHQGYRSEPYYTIIRTLPSIKFGYNSTLKRLYVDNLHIKIQDVGTLFFFYQESGAIIDEYEPMTGYDQNGAIIDFKHTVKPYRETIQNPSAPDPQPAEIPCEFTIKSMMDVHRGAYYQGEIPSWLVAWDATPEPPPEPEPDPTLYQIDFKEIELNPSSLIFTQIGNIYTKVDEAYKNGSSTNILEDFRTAYGNRMTGQGYYMDTPNNRDYNDPNMNTASHPYKEDFTIKANNDLGLPAYDQRGNNWGRQTNDQYDHVDHSGTSIGKSFYTWEASNLINSLEQTQKNIGGQQRLVSGDAYTLYKYADANPPQKDNGAYCLMIGTHQVQLWRNIWSPTSIPFGDQHISSEMGSNYVTYYMNGDTLSSIDWQYDPQAAEDARADYPALQYYPKHAFSISNSALLHRYENQELQITEKDILYSSFLHKMYAPSGWLRRTSGMYKHFSMNKTFYLIKASDNNVLLEDNWICMHIRTSWGRYAVNENPVNVYSTTKYTDPSDTNDTTGQIIASISMYFFFPDGRCVYAILDRYDSYGFGEHTYSTWQNAISGLGHNAEYYLQNWNLKFYGDFGTDNREVFLKIYNKNNFTSGNLKDSNYSLFGSNGHDTIHEYDGIEYKFSPYPDNEVYDPILYPNTLVKNAEGNKVSILNES